MRNAKGFTVLELVVAIMVGVILTTIAIRSTAGVQQRMAVKQARNVFASMHARARAQAVEFGDRVLLNVSTEGDSIWVSRGGTTLEVIDFQDEMRVDIQGEETTYTVCMNARGFAEESCNVNLDAAVTLSFATGGETASLQVLPLGQVIY